MTKVCEDPRKIEFQKIAIRVPTSIVDLIVSFYEEKPEKFFPYIIADWMKADLEARSDEIAVQLLEEKYHIQSVLAINS